MIYFDSASTKGLLYPELIEALREGIGPSPMRALGPSGDPGASLIEQTREQVAAYFFSDALAASEARHFAFVPSATYALNFLLESLIQEGDRVWISPYEHNAVLRPLARLQDRKQIDIKVLPHDARGRILPKLPEDVQLEQDFFVLSHVSNVTGEVTPLDALFAECRPQRLILDLAQSAGRLPISDCLSELRPLAFACSGHKGFGALPGLGLLYLRQDQATEVFSGGTGQHSFNVHQPAKMPDVFELGTYNFPAILSLSKLLNSQHQPQQERAHFAHALDLTRSFIDSAQNLPGIELFSSAEFPIVSFRVKDIDTSDLANELAARLGLICRVGSHCAPQIHRLLGSEQSGLIRFSFDERNTREEISQVLQELSNILRAR